MKAKNLTNLIGLITLLVFALSACSGPAAQTGTPEVVIPFEESATPEVTVPAGDPNRFVFQSVEFSLDPALAMRAGGEVIPEKALTTDGPYWAVNPEYINITLEGYAHSGSHFRPVIAVFPVAESRTFSPDEGQTVDSIIAYLAEKPAASEQIPVLPIMNSTQIFHTNLKYLDFKNGSGVRFITQYAQYAAPVNNFEVLYAFQGLTTDGQYIVSIFLPVSHPSLVENMNVVPAAELEAIAQAPNSYYARMSAELSAQPDSSFTPDLSSLDALVQSLRINN